MGFRDDGEALRARNEALERELAEEKERRLAAEAQVEAERERRRAEVQAARQGREKQAAWYLLAALVALGGLCGVSAALGYDEMGRLHGAAKLDEAMAGKLARQHIILLLVWAAHAVSVAACGVAAALVLRRSAVRATVSLVTAALPAVTAAVQMAFLGQQNTWLVQLVFLAAIATEVLAFRLRQAER